MLFDLLRGSLTLDTHTFACAIETVDPLRYGLLVVVLAGVSNALGQSVALFAHRVSPRRFLASIALEALLFTLAFTLWALAIWTIASLDAATPTRAMTDVLAALGLAHAPLLLAFFILMPYFGAPIGTLLSIWTLLAAMTATIVLYDLGWMGAAMYAGSGWLLAFLLQRGLGRPLERIGRTIVQRFRARDAQHAHP